MSILPDFGKRLANTEAASREDRDMDIVLKSNRLALSQKKINKIYT